MISKWKPVIRRLSFAGKIAKSVLKTACALAFGSHRRLKLLALDCLCALRLFKPARLAISIFKTQLSDIPLRAFEYRMETRRSAAQSPSATAVK